MVKLTFHGAAQTVTGSQHLIEVNGKKILLDCGLYQGKRSEANERNRNLPFEAKDIDAMVLSHAHIDHSGNIPNLVKSGFEGDIVCTFATRDLCATMLRDSGHIQEKDAEYLNKKRKKKGEPPIDPIYTENDALDALKYFLSVGYERSYQIVPGVRVTLYDAGHILGSSMVVLDIEDEEEKKDVRLVFSGDIGRAVLPILRAPTMLDEADIVIMESTYGGRTHPTEAANLDAFRDVLKKTADRGGKVIIPAFAVGRTQQLVYGLNQLYHKGELPNMDVYVDSPLAVNVTEIFRMHPEAYNVETLRYMADDDPDGDVFGFRRLRYIRDVEDSKQLNTKTEPAIIISASGMAEAGRILHHLKNNIENPKNTIMIVGWQAPDTLGRRIVDKISPVRIFGEEYQLRAEVTIMNGMSGHADHQGLMDWANAFKKKPEQVFLVHGEVDAATTLAGDLRNKTGIKTVNIPEMHQSFTV